jgi:acyl-CoA thioesterase-1
MSFMPQITRAGPVSSYGNAMALVQTIARVLALTMFAAAVAMAAAAGSRAAPAAPAPPVKIVALGDSLTAGLGLPREAAFPARLEAALKAQGAAVEITDAGVSGDTASGGLERLDWSVPEGTDAVIVELGANDALRGVDPAVTRGALDNILRRLAERHIVVLLAGMRAPPNMGADYVRAFDAIFPELAKAHDVLLYPFFLDGVAANRALNQGDGLHPTAEGVAAIVQRILPSALTLVARVKAKRAS